MEWIDITNELPPVGETVLILSIEGLYYLVNLDKYSQWQTNECETDWGYNGESEFEYLRRVEIRPLYWSYLPLPPNILTPLSI